MRVGAEVEDRTDVLRLLDRIRQTTDHAYHGGVNGTCYECPYASKPLERSGREAIWDEIRHDPTEAWFRCSLPGRSDEVEWGEYAPCTQTEWLVAHVDMVKALLTPADADTHDVD